MRSVVGYEIQKYDRFTSNIEVLALKSYLNRLHFDLVMASMWFFHIYCINDVDTFGGRQPQPGSGKPSEPNGQGASNPGTPWFKI